MTRTASRPAPRVLLVNNSRDTFTPTVSGAIGTCLWELTQAAERWPGDCHVLSADADAEPYPLSNLHLVPRPAASRGPRLVRRVRSRLSPWAHDGQKKFARSALRAVRQLEPDVVLLNNDPEVALYLARKLPGTKVQHWFHNLEVPSDAMRRGFARSQVVSFAVSDYLARAVEQAYRLGYGEVRTARNGVDSTRFMPLPERPGARADQLPVVGFLGRVCIEKGVDLFLEAVSELHERGVELTATIIGDTNWGFSDGGEYGSRVQSRVDDLVARGVEVRRPGHVGRADLPAVLAGLDLQVVPSRWDEPCALTVLEGMASGNALIGAATGGTPELIGDAGLLVPRENSEALANAIASLLGDEAERTRLGRAARRRAEQMRWASTWRALRLGDIRAE